MGNHPLTSKERRGLTAIAAAALVCIAAGLFVRTCRPAPPPVRIIEQVTPDDSNLSDKSNKSDKSDKSDKSKRKKSSKKKDKPKKTYPSRDYLDDSERLD